MPRWRVTWTGCDGQSRRTLPCGERNARRDYDGSRRKLADVTLQNLQGGEWVTVAPHLRLFTPIEAGGERGTG